MPVTNFYQRRSWWFQGPEVGDAQANIFVPGAFHQTIKEALSVRRSIEETIIESRSLTDSLGVGTSEIDARVCGGAIVIVPTGLSLGYGSGA